MAIGVRGLAPLLEIFDMPTSISFYREALGFNVVSTSHTGEDFDWALLSLNGVEMMLNTAYEAAERTLHPDPRSAAHSGTAIYFECPDVDAAYEYLRRKGVKTQEPQTARYGMRQLYLLDPDGYRLMPAMAGIRADARGMERTLRFERSALRRLRSRAGARPTTNSPTANSRTVRATQSS